MVLIFAILNEAIIEYLFGGVSSMRPYLPLLSLVSAIYLVFSFQINILSLFLGVETTSPFLDFLLTSFVIARLSNVMNGFIKKHT